MRGIALAALFLSGPAQGHDSRSLAEASLWLVLLACAPIYAFGARALWRQARFGRGLSTANTAAACAGWLALVVALAPPVDQLAQVSFAAHMAQHEILMLVAAPLLVLGKPLAAFAWALPPAQRRSVSGLFQASGWRRFWGWLVMPLTAWSLHALALWSWHTPAWFEAGLRNEALHDLQHVSFLGSALLFWWALLRRQPDGIAILYVFTTLLHTGLLGALITFAPNVWYPTYAVAVNPWDLSPLADQQLGGLIMWVPAGGVLIGACLLLLAKWLARLDRRHAGRWSDGRQRS